MSTHTKVLCDICGEPAQHKSASIQVAFLTEQTEGRYVTPHLSNEKLDMCDECMKLLIKRHPLNGAGAQGCNKYIFTPLSTVAVMEKKE